MKIRIVAAVYFPLSFLASPALANTASELVEVGGRFGLSAVATYATSRQLEIAPSDLPYEAQSEALEGALRDYAVLRNSHTGGQNGFETLGNAGDALASASASFPTATGVAGVILGLGVRLGASAINRSLEREEERRAGELLTAVRDELIESAGVEDFRALVGQPAVLADVVRNAQGPLGDMWRRAEETGDPGLSAFIEDALLAAANQTAMAAVEQTAVNARDIDSLEDSVIELATATRDGFRRVGDLIADHEGRIGGLERNVNALQGAVAVLDDRVGQLGRNQDLIADFMMSRMTPAERLNALESGLMDARIVCPSERPNCDRAQLRRDLIGRYRRQAELQETFDDFSEVLNTANAITTIFTNIGVPLPREVGEALRIGNAAFSAATSFASGNVLGGMVALSGLFGGGSDPAAERHAQLMRYLGVRFDHIDEQLAGLREGQQRIAEGLVTVSGQIDRMHRDLSSRLNVLNGRLFQLSQDLRTVLWDDWSACNAVYTFAQSPNTTDGASSFIDEVTHVFASFEGRFSVIRARAPEIRTCRTAMIRAGDVVRSSDVWDRHGWFLDLERINYQVDPDQQERLLQALQQEDATDYSDLSVRHRNGMVAPSTAILRAWADRHGISRASLLHALATDPENMADVRAIMRLLISTETNEAWRHSCSLDDPRRALLAEVLCATPGASESLAGRHLATALNTSFMTEAAQYAIVMSQLIDLYAGETDTFARSFDEVAVLTGEAPGRGLVRTYLAMGNLAIAHDQRLHGGLTALIIADDIIAGRATTAHRTVLAANRVLAENTAAALMHRWLGTWSLSDFSTTGPSFEDRYAQAIIHARSGAATALDPLVMLFRRDRGFVVVNGLPMISLALPGGSVDLPLPGPMQLSEGRFVMPPEHADVTAARDVLLDRYMDYEMGSNPDLVMMMAALN